MANVTTPADFRQLELLLDTGDPIDALNLVTQQLQQDPANRQLQLLSLLARISAFGIEPVEPEIDGLRALNHLTDSERAIVTRILRHGLEAAVRSRDAGKAWVYRRSLRRLNAGLSLDRPFTPLRLDRQRPAENLTAGEVATVRDVFLAEPDQRAARSDRATMHVINTLKKSHQRLASLRKLTGNVTARVALKCSDIRRNCRDQMMAMIHSRVFRALTSRAMVETAVSVIVVIAGWSLLGGKISQAPYLNQHGETESQVPAAPAQAKLALGTAASSTPSDGAPGEPRAGLDQADPRKSDTKSGGAGDRAVPLLERGKKPPPGGQRARVLHAVQSVGLRGEPRFGAAKEHSLASGARVILIESRGSWLKVRSEANGSTGYVRREFLVARSAAQNR
ncbi:MAG TPA: SH3 domain-containing protein [Candidatus Binatia bacterium]|nr:SH3 domain-containing protein [Candidatus Binatia bacterium]